MSSAMMTRILGFCCCARAGALAAATAARASRARHGSRNIFMMQLLLLGVGSLQVVHALGGSEGPPAPGAIATCVEPLGTGQRCIECRSCIRLCAFHGTRRRLAIELRTN